MNWWDKPFQVERVCTCKSRSYECVTRGFHVVDAHETKSDAIADALACERAFQAIYRVVESKTGNPI